MLLLALVGDEDGGDDHVDLAADHRRDQAAEVQIGEPDLLAEIGGEALRELDFEVRSACCP